MASSITVTPPVWHRDERAHARRSLRAGAGLERPASLADGGESAADGAADQHVAPAQADPRPRPDSAHDGLFLPRDEPQCERRDGGAQIPARTVRTTSSPGSAGMASATAAIPYWALDARTDASIPPAASHPPRGGAMPAHAGERATS